MMVVVVGQVCVIENAWLSDEFFAHLVTENVASIGPHTHYRLKLLPVEIKHT